MGHYWSEMASNEELSERAEMHAEIRSWQEAGYKSHSHRDRELLCPHAACIVEEGGWRKHEEFHAALLPQMLIECARHTLAEARRDQQTRTP